MNLDDIAKDAVLHEEMPPVFMSGGDGYGKYWDATLKVSSRRVDDVPQSFDIDLYFGTTLGIYDSLEYHLKESSYDVNEIEEVFAWGKYNIKMKVFAVGVNGRNIFSFTTEYSDRKHKSVKFHFSGSGDTTREALDDLSEKYDAAKIMLLDNDSGIVVDFSGYDEFWENFDCDRIFGLDNSRKRSTITEKIHNPIPAQPADLNQKEALPVLTGEELTKYQIMFVQYMLGEGDPTFLEAYNLAGGNSVGYLSKRDLDDLSKDELNNLSKQVLGFLSSHDLSIFGFEARLKLVEGVKNPPYKSSFLH